MAFLRSPAARRFSATLAAAAMALALMTAAAVPARAGGNRTDFANATAALGAIQIRNTNRYDNPGARRGYWQPQDHRRAIVLPTYCAVELRGYRQNEVVYPARCLREAGIKVRLPERCEVSLRGRGRTAYEQRCLLQSGFREQGRRRY